MKFIHRGDSSKIEVSILVTSFYSLILAMVFGCDYLTLAMATWNLA